MPARGERLVSSRRRGRTGNEKELGSASASTHKWERNNEVDNFPDRAKENTKKGLST